MKKVILIVSLGIFGIGALPVAGSVEASAVSMFAEEIQPRADIIEWRYKMVDGHLYKRKYNASKQKWVGDWIFVA